ncbi:ABC transporter permease [Longimycelium tulufanense]|uniref:ABC transporter permease n=1 Tax=Longimycelium tulufanense TaxID=907463 RepID=A0A8J3C948_9PSEU|nr:ABC-2 family transporter protein [Longimycelium tulufanense]GGM59125.1 ABC transporter permease [Longimycelium tulufanense]
MRADPWGLINRAHCYPRLVLAGFRRYSAYRAAMLAGLSTNVVFGLMRVGLLLAVIGERPRVAGYDAAAAVTYVWLGQGMIATVSMWSGFHVAERVRSGDIAIDLGRPWDFQLAELAGDLGRFGYHLVTRMVPPVAFGVLFFPFRWPQRLSTWGWFAVSLLLAVMVSFGIRYLLNLSAFWLVESRGLISIYGVASGLLAGLVIPLHFFPEGIRTILWWTPFPALMQDSLDVFVERGSPLPAVGHQLLWAVLLLLAGRLVQRSAERKLVVQGG